METSHQLNGRGLSRLIRRFLVHKPRAQRIGRSHLGGPRFLELDGILSGHSVQSFLS